MSLLFKKVKSICLLYVSRSLEAHSMCDFQISEIKGTGMS